MYRYRYNICMCISKYTFTTAVSFSRISTPHHSPSGPSTDCRCDHQMHCHGLLLTSNLHVMQELCRISIADGASEEWPKPDT